MKRILALIAMATIAASAFADSGDTMNFRFDPLGLVIGGIGVDLDFKVNSNWTIGPELEFLHAKIDASSDDFSSNYDVKAWGIGARANWFHNGVFTSGLYVGPSLNYISVKVTNTDDLGDSFTGSASALLLGCVVGYAWFWDTFNIMLGGGADVGLGTASVTVSDSNGNSNSVNTSLSGLKLEFSLGWTF